MSDNLAKQTIEELHSLVGITLDLYDRLEELGDELAEARDLDHIALGLFDRIEELEAENNLLREAGQAVLGRFGTPPWNEAEDTGYAINRLRAALKKGEE